VKFHGRLHPGRIQDLSKPIEVRIHQPRKLAGVTVKIWELDAFLGADGKPRREGSPDDLLATFTGEIDPAPPGNGRLPDWRTFKVASVTIAEAPPETLRIKLVFPGSPTIYEIPIVSEAAEVEGTEYELGISIEHGGAEKFRTRSPCLLAVPRTVAKVRELLVLALDDDGEPIRESSESVPTSFDRIVLAKPAANEDDETKLAVLVNARVHPSGVVIADRDDVMMPLGLNLLRPLAAVVHRADADASSPLASLATSIAKDGAVEIIRPDRSFTLSMFVAGIIPTLGTKGEHPHLTLEGDPFSDPIDGTPALATRRIARRDRKAKR
jgi:hypothetical protein